MDCVSEKASFDNASFDFGILATRTILTIELRKVRKEKNSSKRLPATDEPGEES